MLDAVDAKRFSVFFVGKTRNEQLADYYLQRSGIAGVWIDHATGDTGALNVVTIDRFEGRSIFCCRTFHDAFMLARECYLYRDIPIDQRAYMRGVGLSPHNDVIARAMEAVAVVNHKIREMQLNGGMKPINQAFKEQRKAEPWLRYNDFLHRHKEALLEAMAWETGQR